MVAAIDNAQEFNSLSTIFKLFDESFLPEGQTKLKYEAARSLSFRVISVHSRLDLS
jgi:hypothetical protein